MHTARETGTTNAGTGIAVARGSRSACCAGCVCVWVCCICCCIAPVLHRSPLSLSLRPHTQAHNCCVHVWQRLNNCYLSFILLPLRVRACMCVCVFYTPLASISGVRVLSFLFQPFWAAKQIVILLTKLLIFGPAGGRASDVCVGRACGGYSGDSTRPRALVKIQCQFYRLHVHLHWYAYVCMPVCVCIFNVSFYLLGRHFYLQSQTQILNMLVNSIFLMIFSKST